MMEAKMTDSQFLRWASHLGGTENPEDLARFDAIADRYDALLAACQAAWNEERGYRQQLRAAINKATGET